MSNGPTEAVNYLIKRIKRIGFGFRRFTHYRIRVLLYAGRPNWDLLNTIDPDPMSHQTVHQSTKLAKPLQLPLDLTSSPERINSIRSGA